MMKYLFLILVITTWQSAFGQDISLLHLQGTMPGTFINPALILDKKINVSLAQIYLSLGTDGPSLNTLTSKNTSGQRYIDIKKLSGNLDSYHNVFFANDIRTLDVSIKAGGIAWMAGHGFRSSANVRYPRGLVELAAQGNAAFVGQTIQVGPTFDVLAYNELYLGAQRTLGNFTLGVKAKLLYGTSSISTERSDVLLTTKADYYQLELKNDYLIRSSALFRYSSLDSITVKYTGFTFDNLFYNNRGFALDIGASFKINKQITISASALDIGSIKWDFFPRKYTSKGTFTFEGIDLAEYLGDTTFTGIKDTLLGIIKVKSQVEEYSTTLNSTFTVAGTYDFSSSWSFNALYMLRNDYGYRNNILSVSAVKKFKYIDAGLMYRLSKGNFTSLGIYGRLKVGPVSGYVSTDNIIGLVKPFDNKSATLRIGATIQL
ncbi:MAG: hypothetical protein IPN89_13495 [Saprospiraceae bacterium]|jgi:hypothetical protein|nr:hypothetical protein [Saprospiraceae bacterium]